MRTSVTIVNGDGWYRHFIDQTFRVLINTSTGYIVDIKHLCTPKTIAFIPKGDVR